MQLGLVAAVMSIIAALYALVIAFILTRAIIRSLVNARPPVQRMHIVLEDKRAKCD
jgi:hypothetical protein